MEKKLQLWKKTACLVLMLCSMPAAFASALTSQPEVQQFINQTAEKYHFSPGNIRSILNQARYAPAAIQHMENPYEALPWTQYRALFVTADRIQEGINYWNLSNKLVDWEQNEYDVPGNIILAIVGVETRYGEKMGNFRVLDTLSTLAFYYPKQAQFFQKQLAAFIAMSNTYHLNPTTLLGSYAGAMGQCQFMPSSYLYFGVDFSGHSKPDLFNSRADVIFSVGNYLRQNGWEPGQPIAVAAKIVGPDFQRIVKTDMTAPTMPTMTLRQLANYGVTPINGHFNPDLKAELISFQGEMGQEYWITFENFYVITRYNTSYQYAMAVFQLSQQLQHAWNMKQQTIVKNNQKAS